MPPNPNAEDYPAGSRSRFMAERFADAYMRLLKALQQTVEGAPEGLAVALGLMFELRFAAQETLATPDPSGRPTGLCFRYSPAGRAAATVGMLGGSEETG
jgi:hypothetical protein